MAEKEPSQDKSELPLNEVLRPPPRRKKSLKKSRIEAEKSLRRRLNSSDNVNPVIKDSTLTANDKTKTNQETVICAENSSVGAASAEEVPSIKPVPDLTPNNSAFNNSECEKQSSAEPKPTNEIQINDSKVEEQPDSSKENKMTEKASLSMDENRNTCPRELEKTNEDCRQDDMGNKTSSSFKSHFQNALSASEGSPTCYHDNQGSIDSTAVVESITSEHNEIESYCWVAVDDNTSSSPTSNEEILNAASQPGVEALNVANNANISKEISQHTKGTTSQNGHTSANNFDDPETPVVLKVPVVSNESLSSTVPAITGVTSEEISINNTESESGNTTEGSSEIINKTATSTDTESFAKLSMVSDQDEISKDSQLGNTDSHRIPVGLEVTSKSTIDSGVIDTLSNNSSVSAGGVTKENEISNEVITPSIDSNVVDKVSNMAENNETHSTVNDKSATLNTKLTSLSDSKKIQEKKDIPDTTDLDTQGSVQSTTKKVIMETETKSKAKNSCSSKGKERRKGSIPYEHMGESLSSVEEYELWEEENFFSDSDSDIFYSDDSSSSGGEGYYDIQHNEKLWGTHNVDGEQVN